MGIVGELAWPIVSRLPLGGDLAVSPHGIMVAVGVVVGAAMMRRRVHRLGGLVGGAGHVDGAGHGAPGSADDVDAALRDLLGWVLVGAVLGARGFFVLTHLDQYASAPLQVLAVQEGGLTFLGGVTGGVVAGWVVARRHGWDVLGLLDASAPGLALGLAVGRLGDLAIGDHLGAPTDAWWGWRCVADANPVGGPNALGWVAPTSYPTLAVDSGAIPPPIVGCFDTAVVPTALVDGVASLVVAGLLLVLERREPARGMPAATWVVGYGVLRVAGDVLRRDRRVAGLTGTQWALAVAVTVVVALVVRRRRVA